jgi:hypothetical protein
MSLRFKIQHATIWKPQVFFTITPSRNLNGNIEAVVISVINRLARAQGIHIENWLGVGDYRTGNREHLHGILSSDQLIDIKMFKRLLRGSPAKGRMADGNSVVTYDSKRGAIEYIFGKHRAVESFVSCPMNGDGCRYSKKRGLYDSCLYRRKPTKALSLRGTI